VIAYYVNLFSPETYEAFSASSRDVSGFRPRQRNAARRLKPGDRMICYMTKLSRWIGVFEVIDGPFEEDTPIFYAEDDPFVIRFHVRPLVWLDKECAVPIQEPEIWSELSFTKGHEQGSRGWTGKLRVSLGRLEQADGELLDAILRRQAETAKTYPVDEDDYQKLVTHRVRRTDRTVSVSVPTSDTEDDQEQVALRSDDVRESLKIQALLADIGSIMGFKVWLPRSDRARVEGAMKEDGRALLDVLPLNYDDTTLKTIEQIDCLWLTGRSISRAFEVEHTTSVYSGILRMADLLALQPNMDIKLHIVAPVEHREKVFTEVRRPVFSLLDRAPLAECCTFIAYDSLRELAQQPHLQHLSDSVIDEYSEEAD
jgi:hypothetical protein